MNIFLIWSGDTSHAVALALHEWIPKVIQAVKPFLSSENIRKGQRWQQVVAQQLEEVKYAIVCLTSDNLSAPWIHYEAGAASKHLEVAKVTSLLIGIEPRNIDGPLTQFQNTTASQSDLFKMMTGLNAELGDARLSDAT